MQIMASNDILGLRNYNLSFVSPLVERHSCLMRLCEKWDWCIIQDAPGEKAIAN
jgi:hypothetical protein